MRYIRCAPSCTLHRRQLLNDGQVYDESDAILTYILEVSLSLATHDGIANAPNPWPVILQNSEALYAMCSDTDAHVLHMVRDTTECEFDVAHR